MRIVGESDLGKTHLFQALAVEVAERLTAEGIPTIAGYITDLESLKGIEKYRAQKVIVIIDDYIFTKKEMEDKDFMLKVHTGNKARVSIKSRYKNISKDKNVIVIFLSNDTLQKMIGSLPLNLRNRVEEHIIDLQCYEGSDGKEWQSIKIIN